MLTQDYWKMYLAVLVSGCIMVLLIKFLGEREMLDPLLFGITTLLFFGALSIFLKKPKWIKYYLIYMIAISALAILIGITNRV